MICTLAVVFAATAVAAGGKHPEAATATTLDDHIRTGARILVVGAHPDDETLVGPILAKACIQMAAPCHFAILTTGAGGDCSLKTGCPSGLGKTRMQEMQRVADRYGASLSWGDFRNFPHTGTQESWWYDHIRRDWAGVTDPVAWIQDEIEAFQPDLVFSVDPEHGFYGHAEHVLTGRLVAEALGLRTVPYGYGRPATTLSHRPKALYTILNHYWGFRPFVGRDPMPANETWHAKQPCSRTRTCMDFAVDIAKNHASQAKSGIGLFVFASKFIRTLYLHRTELQ